MDKLVKRTEVLLVRGAIEKAGLYQRYGFDLMNEYVISKPSYTLCHGKASYRRIIL